MLEQIHIRITETSNNPHRLCGDKYDLVYNNGNLELRDKDNRLRRQAALTCRESGEHPTVASAMIGRCNNDAKTHQLFNVTVEDVR